MVRLVSRRPMRQSTDLDLRVKPSLNTGSVRRRSASRPCGPAAPGRAERRGHERSASGRGARGASCDAVAADVEFAVTPTGVERRTVIMVAVLLAPSAGLSVAASRARPSGHREQVVDSGHVASVGP